MLFLTASQRLASMSGTCLCAAAWKMISGANVRMTPSTRSASATLATITSTGVVGHTLNFHERFRADDLGTMAAALAFQAFLSLFPILLLGLSIAGFLLGGNPAGWLRRFFDAVPGIGPLLDRNLEAIVRARGSLGIVALGGVAWAASGLTGRASDALGRIFRLPGRNVVRRRVRSLLALLLLGAALLAALLVSGTIAAIHAEGWWSLPVRGLTLVALAGLELAFFAGTYAVLTPPGGPPVRAHLPGAALITVGWGILKLVGGVTIATVVTRSGVLYGTIGAVFGLLVFLRVATSLYLVGAELSAVLAEQRAAAGGISPP